MKFNLHKVHKLPIRTIDLFSEMPFVIKINEFKIGENNVEIISGKEISNENNTIVYVDDYDCEEIMEILCSIETNRIINIDKNLNSEDTKKLRSVMENQYFSICTDFNDVPVYCSPRRLSYKERSEVKLKLDELLEKSIIRPSDSA